MEYQLVPESEANFKLGKIAVSSPIAQGLIGKKVGDVVNIKVPSGIIPFEIIIYFNVKFLLPGYHGNHFYKNH